MQSRTHSAAASFESLSATVRNADISVASAIQLSTLDQGSVMFGDGLALRAASAQAQSARSVQVSSADIDVTGSQNVRIGTVGSMVVPMTNPDAA